MIGIQQSSGLGVCDYATVYGAKTDRIPSLDKWK